MQVIACILRTKDAFPAAVEYLRTILKVDPTNGDVWGSLGKTPFGRFPTCNANLARPLLPDDGRLAAGLLSLPTSSVPPFGSKGMFSLTCGQGRRLTRTRNPSCGMALVSCMTATAPWSMPKKPSRKLCAWSLRLKRQTRSTSVSA